MSLSQVYPTMATGLCVGRKHEVVEVLCVSRLEVGACCASFMAQVWLCSRKGQAQHLALPRQLLFILMLGRLIPTGQTTKQYYVALERRLVESSHLAANAPPNIYCNRYLLERQDMTSDPCQ